jgi:hypothetical protein
VLTGSRTGLEERQGDRLIEYAGDAAARLPGATFPLWNSYLEIRGARPRGYAVQTVLNRPMSPDVVVMIEGDPINVDLVGSYAVSSVPYHRGFGSSCTGEKILIYEKYSNTPN